MVEEELMSVAQERLTEQEEIERKADLFGKWVSVVLLWILLLIVSLPFGMLFLFPVLGISYLILPFNFTPWIMGSLYGLLLFKMLIDGCTAIHRKIIKGKGDLDY